MNEVIPQRKRAAEAVGRLSRPCLIAMMGLALILGHAVKFTPEGGRVEAGARLTDGAVEISVSDTGVGITFTLPVRPWPMS